jgi:hypothetical protein
MRLLVVLLSVALVLTAVLAWHYRAENTNSRAELRLLDTAIGEYLANPQNDGALVRLVHARSVAELGEY